MGWRKVLGQIVEDAELLACHLAGRTPDRNIQTPEEVEATMKMVELAMHRCLPKRLRTMPSAFLQMPPADRIALARELLAGTGRVVARDVDAPEIATSWFAGGWVACRATMLADDGENND